MDANDLEVRRRNLVRQEYIAALTSLSASMLCEFAETVGPAVNR